MKHASYCLITLLILAACPAYALQAQRFAVYYNTKAPFAELSRYDLLVFDADHHPPLAPLREKGKALLGYISIGEVEKNRAYFSRLQRAGITLQENKNWRGSYVIDVRQPLWTKTVLEDLIPSLIRKGFDGVFLDTVDSPLELERTHPHQYKGLSEATAHLIKSIRAQYPRLKIMVNRGYALLPKLAPDIDMVLGESVYADYNFDTKTYGRVENALYQTQVSMLNEAKAHNSNLAIYTLDYADKSDTGAIKEIYSVQRANGFIPYVATIDLNELVPEPAP